MMSDPASVEPRYKCSGVQEPGQDANRSTRWRMPTVHTEVRTPHKATKFPECAAKAGFHDIGGLNRAAVGIFQ